MAAWAAKTPPGETKATSMPAAAGPASDITDSATRMAPLAPCTSRARRGTVLATPGWKRAAAAPLRAPMTQSCHRTTWPVKNMTAASVWVTSRTASAPIISSRVLTRSATTPPKITRLAKQATEEAMARPTAPAPYPCRRRPAARATGSMVSPSLATARAVKKRPKSRDQKPRRGRGSGPASASVAAAMSFRPPRRRAAAPPAPPGRDHATGGSGGRAVFRPGRLSRRPARPGPGGPPEGGRGRPGARSR